MKSFMTMLLIPLALMLNGCTSDKGGGGGDGGVFDYSGTWETTVEFHFTDNTGVDETGSFSGAYLAEQDGEAMAFAGILMRVPDEDGVATSYKSESLTFFGVFKNKVEASTGDEPTVIKLTIEGEYPDLGYSFTYDYKLTLGDEIDVSAFGPEPTRYLPQRREPPVRIE